MAILAIIPADMSIELGDALMTIDLFMLAVFLIVAFIDKIDAGFSRLLHYLNPFALLGRLRRWSSAHTRASADSAQSMQEPTARS